MIRAATSLTLKRARTPPFDFSALRLRQVRMVSTLTPYMALASAGEKSSNQYVHVVTMARF